MVEQFNHFINLYLTVFNNYSKHNIVFFYGAMMTFYECNSYPVSGMGIDRYLLVIGKYFHLPIDFKTW